MNSYLPVWVGDVADVMSLIGFVVTCFLFVEARKIRHSFMRKARIPEIVGDLDRISSELVSALKAYATESRVAHEKLQRASALLESILPKVPEKNKEKIVFFITSSKAKLSGPLGENECWDLYAQLSGVVTYLQQISKDTRWD